MSIRLEWSTLSLISVAGSVWEIGSTCVITRYCVNTTTRNAWCSPTWPTFQTTATMPCPRWKDRPRAWVMMCLVDTEVPAPARYSHQSLGACDKLVAVQNWCTVSSSLLFLCSQSYNLNFEVWEVMLWVWWCDIREITLNDWYRVICPWCILHMYCCVFTF